MYQLPDERIAILSPERPNCVLQSRVAVALSARY
jgi:hypothetical protein